jgi:TolB-like protein/Tfp pilus assembly protein PilF
MDLSTDRPGRLRFGVFELDVRSRELHNGPAVVRLQEQPFEILRLMLERPGEVVTRDELRQRLWPEGTFVDFEHSLNAAIKRLRAALGDEADNPRFVQTLPRRGYRFIGNLGEETPGPAAGVPRIRLAVLPFANLSQEAEYFTDGLTDEMISQLGQRCRGRVGVVARWSSMVFKGTTERAAEIGRTLRANYLLEGGVRREGDRVRITARLIETAGETQLWTETYERHLTDCLSVQAEVAARIAESLALELVPDAPASQHPIATSVSAYQEYLKARYYWNNWIRPDDAGAEQALASFTEALRLDPLFAPTHAGLARVYVARASHYREQPRAALEVARNCTKRALELDAALAEAHLSLGDVRRMLEWDWRGAEAAYLQSIALNPSQENSHRGYGTMLVALGRREEAIRELDRAVELDPLCLVVGTSAAWVHYLAGDTSGALTHCRRTTDIDPEYLPAWRVMGLVYLLAGKEGEAIRVLEAAAGRSRHDPVFVASLVHARATVGDREAAVDLAAELEQMRRTRYVPSYHAALAQVGLDNVDAAFTLLEQAVIDCDPALGNLAAEPRFEPLRADARFARLLDLLGLA